MHRIPDLKTTAIKMYKQKHEGQKDITGYQSVSNRQYSERQTSIDACQGRIASIYNQNTQIAVMLDHSEEQQQETMESAFLQNLPVQQKPKYCESRQVNVFADQHNALNNSYELQLEVDDDDDDDDDVDDDDEKSKNDYVYENATTYPEEFLRKPFHHQLSKRDAGPFRVRLTPAMPPAKIAKSCPADQMPLDVTAVATSAQTQQDDELEYEVDVDTVLQGDNQDEDLTFVALKPESNGGGDCDGDVNVKNIKTQTAECESFDDGSVCLDRNARRPMNAFLIFCKRHRAIVKERYKSLENRAITKILGDWWASLDGNEKHCFTNLAQKNKDAFFNANPNFKWYKLPAPPLRSSSTRPNNNSGLDSVKQSRLTLINSYIDSSQVPCPNAAIGAVKTIPSLFKLTEGTQTGELMNSQRSVQDNGHALQLALSETSQFFTNSMPTKNYYLKSNSLMKVESSGDFACSSSDEEFNMPTTPNDKSSRRCKGKIYQQLIKSGRIVASPKRMKAAPMQLPPNGHLCYTNSECGNALPPKHFTSHDRYAYNAAPSAIAAPADKFSQVANAEKCDGANASLPCSFDLDNKIKELPALNFDAYLQRKHNTNKKKKFNTKKQRRAVVAAGNSVRINKASAPSDAAANDDLLLQQQVENCRHEKQCMPELTAAIAVGSRKRKARKESITRRDISIIEQEISSIMPLTINGCYYFNECLADQLNEHTAPKSFAAESSTATVHSVASTPTLASPTISSSSSSLSFETLAADGATTNASDLLILAEVAANRTD